VLFAVSIRRFQPLFPRRFEGLIDRLGLFWTDGYLLILLAKYFLHEGDRVSARRQPRDVVFARIVGDRIERALHDVDVHLHPGMLVALNRQHDFLPSETPFERIRRRWLRIVPLAIVFGRGMNIVRSQVRISNFDVLTRHHPEYVRMILATLLNKHDGILGHIERTIPETIFHVNEHIGEVAAFDNDILRGVQPFAGGVRTHIDLSRLRRGAIELHRAVHGCNRRGINGCSRRRRLLLGRSICGLLSILFLVTTGEQHALNAGTLAAIVQLLLLFMMSALPFP
jgi:hypothetical protein